MEAGEVELRLPRRLLKDRRGRYADEIELSIPSKQELDAEYDRGFKEGGEEHRRRFDYNKSRVQREIKKLDQYDKLMARFGIYGDDVDKIMDEFESFRKLNRTHLLWALNSSINSLEQMKQYLEGKEEKT